MLILKAHLKISQKAQSTYPRTWSSTIANTLNPFVMEARNGRDDKAICIGETIMDMPYNASHQVMVNIRRESAHLLDSLKQSR